jgi:hypothetical protein
MVIPRLRLSSRLRCKLSKSKTSKQDVTSTVGHADYALPLLLIAWAKGARGVYNELPLSPEAATTCLNVTKVVARRLAGWAVNLEQKIRIDLKIEIK